MRIKKSIMEARVKKVLALRKKRYSGPEIAKKLNLTLVQVYQCFYRENRNATTRKWKSNNPDYAANYYQQHKAVKGESK